MYTFTIYPSRLLRLRVSLCDKSQEYWIECLNLHAPCSGVFGSYEQNSGLAHRVSTSPLGYETRAVPRINQPPSGPGWSSRRPFSKSTPARPRAIRLNPGTGADSSTLCSSKACTPSHTYTSPRARRTAMLSLPAWACRSMRRGRRKSIRILRGLIALRIVRISDRMGSWSLLESTLGGYR